MMQWFDYAAIWLMKASGVMVLGLVFVWVAWQFTRHIGALFKVWTRMLVWYVYRTRCTCDASDPVKRGLRERKPKRLISWLI